jgi:hypothetical protein
MRGAEPLCYASQLSTAPFPLPEPACAFAPPS